MGRCVVRKRLEYIQTQCRDLMPAVNFECQKSSQDATSGVLGAKGLLANKAAPCNPENATKNQKKAEE